MILKDLISFLKENSLEALKEQYYISAKQHNYYPNLYLLKYNQIDSDMSIPIVQTCRGIILDKDNNWNPVCFPYTKFFNIGEPNAAVVDWKTAKVYEKLDGSLCQLYFYDKQWHVATSGLPDALGQVNAERLTFKDLFWNVWHELGYELPEATNVCYFFELMTPDNRIVVNHKKNRLVLHGARDLLSLKEYDPQYWSNIHKWECVKTFPFANVEEVTESFKDMDPLEQEGYIVCDASFNRVKIKAPQYVTLHHAISNLTTRNLLNIVRTGELNEFIAYFPSIVEEHSVIAKRFSNLCLTAQEEYDKVKHIENQKEFALTIKDNKFASAMFAVRKKQFQTFREYFASITIEKLEDLIKE